MQIQPDVQNRFHQPYLGGDPENARRLADVPDDGSKQLVLRELDRLTAETGWVIV